MQAMQKSVRIGSTMLAGTQKQGILKPDSQGYYPCPVGAYNAYNSGGFLYDSASGLSMFQPGSQLMRQAEKGCLYGEYKHPEKLPGQSDQEYIRRIRKIDPDRYSHHIREYELVPSRDEHGRPITLVIAWLKPFGPFGQHVETSLTTPAMNTYFSVRSITIDDMMNRVKHTREVITHDFVGEGGIFVAQKHRAPSLEDFDQGGVILTPDIAHQLAREQDEQTNLGLEHAGTDWKGLIAELGWEHARGATARRPDFMAW